MTDDSVLRNGLTRILRASEAWSCDETDCHECSGIHQLGAIARAALSASPSGEETPRQAALPEGEVIRAAAFAEAAEVADGWLQTFRDRKIDYVDAQKYASD